MHKSRLNLERQQLGLHHEQLCVGVSIISLATLYISSLLVQTTKSQSDKNFDNLASVIAIYVKI
jgi:hypothetical protein